jgi:hypothetical protein
MLVEAMLKNKCFSRFKYHMFYNLYSFMSYLLTPSYLKVRTTRNMMIWEGTKKNNYDCFLTWQESLDEKSCLFPHWDLPRVALSLNLHPDTWLPQGCGQYCILLVKFCTGNVWFLACHPVMKLWFVLLSSVGGCNEFGANFSKFWKQVF